MSFFFHGYFQATVFFIISGFVLSLNFFKTRQHTCVTGGTFRRYIRLMIPVWVICSFSYFTIKMQLWKPQNGKLSEKKFNDLCYDCLIGVWYGDAAWAISLWTMSIELTATFMVYIISQTSVEYSHRDWIYGLIIAWFLIQHLMNEWGYKQEGDGIRGGNLGLTATGTSIYYHYPLFIFGMVLADLETRRSRPLENLKKLCRFKKICLSSFLFFITISFGSN